MQPNLNESTNLDEILNYFICMGKLLTPKCALLVQKCVANYVLESG